MTNIVNLWHKKEAILNDLGYTFHVDPDQFYVRHNETGDVIHIAKSDTSTLTAITNAIEMAQEINNG